MKNIKLDFYTEEDLHFIYELLSNPEAVEYLPYLYVTSMEQAKLRLLMRLEDKEWEHKRRFLIKDAETDKPIGEISGRTYESPETMEILIVIHPDFRNQGYARASVYEFMRYIMQEEPSVKKFRMEINLTNLASIEVAKKLEFDFQKDKEDSKMGFWEKDVR